MYTALYRKWRPRRFEDVFGQKHITVTLKNELKNNKLSHAYLFCGTRGTGKTSTAKLMAKAVNCSNPIDNNPCDMCESCKSINDGNSIDVFEIDAASNRGIDDIRNLREAIKFTPTLGKYKVYIIDEVHMLTNEAFNALLKTLEEPPDYVLFILATTEPHKLPATVLSRCQRFDFKRIHTDNIIERLMEICKAESLDADDKALRLIARNSDGSMRDALSILDQCAVFGSKSIGYEEVLEVLGIVNNELLFTIGEYILNEDAGSAILVVNELTAGGKDINQFIRDLIMHFRNLLMTKVVDNPEDVIDMAGEGIQLLKTNADFHVKEGIIRCINILAELENEAKWAANPRILLEIALIRMCKISGDDSYAGIAARLSRLETAISEGKLIMQSDTTEKPNKTKEVKTAEPKKQIIKKAEEKLASNSEIMQKWSGLIQELKIQNKIKLRTYLSVAKPVKYEDGILILAYSKEDSFCKTALDNVKIREELEETTTKYFGTEVKIKGIFENEEMPTEEYDIVKKAIGFVGKDKVEIMD